MSPVLLPKATREIARASASSAERVANRQSGIFVCRVDLGALAPCRGLVVRDRSAHTLCGVDRQLAARYGEVDANAKRRTASQMALLALDEDAASDDPVENSAELVCLLVNERAQRLGRIEAAKGDLNR